MNRLVFANNPTYANQHLPHQRGRSAGVERAVLIIR